MLVNIIIVKQYIYNQVPKYIKGMLINLHIHEVESPNLLAIAI